MSCVNVLDNDTTLVPPTFTGDHPCVVVAVPTCNSGGAMKSASASSVMSFNPDGTWQVYGSGGGSASCGTTSAAPSGVLASGNWITGTFNPAEYEIRFTGQQRFEYDTATPSGPLSGCPNPPDPIGYDPPYDSGWLSLASPQSINSAANANCGQVCVISVSAIKTFTVQIRRISNPANSVTGSGSICGRVNNSNDGCV